MNALTTVDRDLCVVGGEGAKVVVSAFSGNMQITRRESIGLLSGSFLWFSGCLCIS